MRLTVTLFVAFLLLVVGTITQAQPPQAPPIQGTATVTNPMPPLTWQLGTFYANTMTMPAIPAGKYTVHFHPANPATLPPPVATYQDNTMGGCSGLSASGCSGSGNSYAVPRRGLFGRLRGARGCGG